ncbi:hypothetical protein MRX96_018175 [Rhipicephalus microplus]
MPCHYDNKERAGQPHAQTQKAGSAAQERATNDCKNFEGSTCCNSDWPTPPRCCRTPSPTDNDPSIVTELQLNDFNGTIAQREQHDTERNAGLSNTNRAGPHTFLPPF